MPPILAFSVLIRSSTRSHTDLLLCFPQVLREKIELENQLEQEEEYIVNELQKKFVKLQGEKAALEARLAEEKESHEALRKTQFAKAQQQNADLQKELLSLKSENFGLTQRISKEQQLLQSIATEKANLEQVLEVEDERAFNLERRQASADDAPGRGGRHRTRSVSLPVHDADVPVHMHSRPVFSGGGIPITAVSVPGSAMSRSGSGGLHQSQESSGSNSSNSSASASPARSPVVTATSPPTSPRTSHLSPNSASDPSSPAGNVSPSTLSPSSSGVSLATSGGGRSRRLSFAQNASLMAQYPTTPRASSSAVVLKQGWIRSTHKSKLTDAQAEDYETDPEPATDLFFVLSDDSTLVAWMNEMRGDDSTGSLFCINLDTVVKRSQDLDSGEFILETKDSFYNLRPQSEDLKEWCELLEQLDPLASK